MSECADGGVPRQVDATQAQPALSPLLAFNVFNNLANLLSLEGSRLRLARDLHGV
jgi:hypothetical protein